jgi:membrane protease YdiL (CAAX protease family)
VPLFKAVEYLLLILFFGLLGGVKGSAEFLSAGATLIAALFAGGLMIVRVDHRAFGALGFARTEQTVRELGTGFAIGGAGIVIATVVSLAVGGLTYVAERGTAAQWLGTVLFDLLVFAIAAAAEEAVFRGYAFQLLVRSVGPATATIGASVLFALAHAGNPNVSTLALVNIFLAGVLLSVAYLRTMSLWFATAVHAGWNWTMAYLFDLPVSGLAMFKTPLYEPVVRGPSWISGGTFGPEGGIAGTLGMAVCVLVLIYLVRLRVAPRMSALEPIALANLTEEHG